MIDREHRETEDEVLRETRRIKEELAARYDFDLGRMIDAARENQKRGGRVVLSPPPRHDEPPRP